MASMGSKSLRTDDHRVIIHFDYDCFYAAVFEREDPKLCYLPLAVQQKQIIVTCNYEARRHGLYKLQRITEARKMCPEAIIVCGEDLNRFRNASKENYNFLRKFAWSGRVERLGFDEVFIDVTDMIDYNMDMMNPNNLQCSFFHLSRQDPTVGFDFDGTTVAGHTVPASADNSTRSIPPSSLNGGSPMDRDDHSLFMRLTLGSHLAQHLRHQLEEHQGYSSTVGISTTKLISKLIGNINKPKGQTTLLPPYSSNDSSESNVTRFLDGLDIGKVPGIGFKMAQKIRDHVLGRPAAFDAGLVYGGTKENVAVKDVRLFPSMGAELFEKLLGGHGAPKGVGMRVWGLINGVDDTQVSKAREVPQQISIEDSYIRLDTMAAVEKELRMLSRSLLSRLRQDLSCIDNDDKPSIDYATGEDEGKTGHSTRQWLARPRSLRLTTRPRPPLNPDGTRSRTFNRISRSCDMPSLALDLVKDVEYVSERLVQETLIPLFQKLHPEKSGWNLSLMNLCATNISLTAASAKDGAGRDISKMFKTQEDVLRDWKVRDDVVGSPLVTQLAAADKHDQEFVDVQPDVFIEKEILFDGANGSRWTINDCEEHEDTWQSDDGGSDIGPICPICGLPVPAFAMTAHERFHDLPD